jgi:hypothetical protein
MLLKDFLEIIKGAKMKKIIFISLFFTACSLGHQTFYISADALPQDKEWLIEAANDVNAHLGCDYFIMVESTQTFTLADKGNGQRQFVVFSNQQDVADALKKSSAVGITNTGNSEGSDILLTSLAPYNYIDSSGTINEFNGDKPLAIFIDTHELGHAMNLYFPENKSDPSHSLNKNDIMYFESGEQVDQNGITDAQWKNYIDKAREAGIVCPKGGK